jgi:chorismate-pyruvate lyase
MKRSSEGFTPPAGVPSLTPSSRPTAGKLTGPDPRQLFALFPQADDAPLMERIRPDEVPPPYDRLLVHTHHMTVTVEKHHGDRVNVRILDRRHEGDSYARKILLALQGSGRVVQFGLVRVNFRYCTAKVRDEIVAGQTPLGRVLIQNNVLRRIEPTSFLRVTPGPAMMGWFGLTAPQTTYGRTGYIYCDGQPAVEVLEIVIPE